jgi:hypothetical protein
MESAAIRWATWLPRRARERAPSPHRGQAPALVSTRMLLAWGWLAVALLFALYVAVLQHSVQRAELIRSGQLSADAKAPDGVHHYPSFSPRR